MAWPWSKQGILSSSMNVPQNMRPYFSGDAQIFQPDENLMGQVPSYTPYTDYSNYEDLIMNPEGVPNRLQNLERFSPVGDPDRTSAYTGETEFIPGYNFKDAPNRPTNVKDWWANREYWNNPAVKNPLEKAASGVAGLFKKLPSPMKLLKSAARNPLDPNSPNFNPMLQGQLDVYGNYVDETGEDPLQGQNLVSGFGTNDVTAQLRKRLQKLRMYDYTSAAKTKKINRIRAAIDAQTAAENAGYTGTPGGNVGSGVFAKMDQSGKTYGPYSGQGGNAGNNAGMNQGGGGYKGAGTSGSYAAGPQKGGGGSYGPWSKRDGGRIGYALAGPVGVEQETDFIQGPQGDEEFSETVVEGQEQPSREQLEALAMEIFNLPVDELDEQQLLVVYQEAMQGQPMEGAVQEDEVQFAAQGGLAGLL